MLQKLLRKYFLVCYILFTGYATVAQSNWEWLNPKPSGDTGRDLYFFDDQHGLLVSDYRIARTQDSGDTWSVVARIGGGRKIEFKDSVGYVVSKIGSVYKSTNSGKTWKIIYSAYSERLNSISLIGQDIVLITSDDKLLVSYDGGVSWTTRQVELNYPYRGGIKDAFFTSASVGHAVCSNGIIIKTIDCGQSWYITENSSISPSDFFDVTFVNKNIGFASREHNELYQTTDGGETWVDLGSTYDAAYRIQFLNEDVGFFAGRLGAIQETLDGGKTWNWIGFNNRILYNDLYAIHFVDEHLGFATGTHGRIIKTVDGGQSWTEYAMTYQDIEDIQLVDSIFFALGESVYRSNDSGQNWIDISPNIHDEYPGGRDYFKAGHFFSQSHGIVVASGQKPYGVDAFFRTKDGGKNWRELDAPSLPPTVSTLFFLDDSVGFVSTRGRFPHGSLYKTTDQGKTWLKVSSDSSGFSQLYFINEQQGFGLFGGDLYQTLDGGYHWKTIYEDYGGDFNQITFVNDSVGYVTADHARILKTVNAGDSWELELIATGADLHAITFLNESVGFVSTDLPSPYLYRTLDGGRSWERVYVPDNPDMMTTNAEGTLFVGGGHGALLKATISLRDLVAINDLTVLQTSNASATLSAYLRSSLDITDVWIEYGTESGAYTHRLPLGSFQGYTDKAVTFAIEQLRPASHYYCRLSVDHGGSTAVSPEVSFTTMQGPIQLNLIDAETDRMVQKLSSEDTLQIDQLALASFSIEASGITADSVHFLLDGPVTWETTDHTAPHTLFGDAGTDYYGKAPVAGDYLLTVTSFVTAKDSATVLTDHLDIQFTMNVDLHDSIASEKPKIEDLVTGFEQPISDTSKVYVYPNAFDNELFVVTSQPATSVKFYLHTLLGNKVYLISNRQIDAEKNGLRVTIDHIPFGAYLLQMISPKTVNIFRIIKRE